MQRYFIKEKKQDKFILYEKDIHHIKNVMRNNIGDKIEIVYEQNLYLCEINNLSPLEFKIINQIKENNEMNTKLTVAISLVQEQKFDLILQKLTELGVSRIIPIKTERSIVKIDENKISKKYDRWNTICKEASEQSHRLNIPKIDEITSLKDLPKINNNLKLICTLNNNKSLKEYLNNNPTEILFAIGPEGGFSENEEKYLLENSFLPVSLGKRVMRVETAAIYVASIINYICEG